VAHGTHSISITALFKLREVMKRQTLVRAPDASEGVVVVYTDASFTGRRGRGIQHLGIVVWDEVTGEKWYSSAACPSYILERFATDWIICQLELLAVLCAQLTYPEVLRGRQVIHFIDNTPALSAVVHGYSSRPDMAELTNMYHLAVACNEVRVWHEYVPSKANIADIPSRPGHRDWHALAAMGIKEFPKRMVFPPAAAWEDYMEIARLLGRA
jgi:hypothetical protein